MTEHEILIEFKEGKKTAQEVLEFYRWQKQKSSRYPLSQAQQGLWVLDNMEPGSSAYNVPVCVRYDGRLNNHLFKAACAVLLKQHPVLNNVIFEEAGQVFQCARTQGDVAIDHQDCQGESWDQIKTRIDAKICRSFDLGTGPLIRFSAFSRSEAEHYLLILVHHIVFDGSSIPLLLKSLFEALFILESGNSLDFPSPAGTYKDFVVEQNFYLKSSHAQNHRAYWLDQLSGDLPQVILSNERTSREEGIQGASVRRELGAPLSEQIRKFCLQSRLNGSVFFLGVFNLLLSRYSGLRDLIVGMPTTGRRGAEFESMVGFFVNMLPLRTRIDFEIKMSEFFGGVKDTLIDAMDNAAWPFQRMVEDLKLKPVRGVAPVFQVGYVYQNHSMVLSAFANQQEKISRSKAVTILPEFHQKGEFKLELEAVEDTAGFALNLKYDAHRFSKTQIETMLNHALNLVKDVITGPDRMLKDYSLLSADEIHKLQVSWNRTAAPFRADATIAGLFEEQVATRPDALALIFNQQRLSYCELNLRANQLAHFLRSRHTIGPDTRIGICLYRCFDIVIGMLAILKAGGAYVPIDPEYPDQRIEYMIEDAGLTAVLTHRELTGRSALLSRCGICLDDAGVQQEISASPTTNISAEMIGLTSTHLAYVIYTSGSTGQPKGTLVEQRSVVRLVNNSHFVPMNSDSVFLACSSFSFDVSVFDVWAPLLNGGRCVLFPGRQIEISAINQLLEQENINTFWLTSALFDQWSHQVPRIACLRWILAGGEAVNPKAVERVYRALPNVAVINGYGPTENTVFSTTYQVPRNFDFSLSIPIGKPIANSRAYVLDENGKLCPEGVAGELYVGGYGVARGYLNRADLTAAKFVDDPFSTDTSNQPKLYRTGDVVRWLTDGNIEFLGRVDDQVKVNGFRIELAEVEIALAGLRQVRDVSVMARPLEHGGKVLVAYLVLTEAAVADSTQALRDVRQQLAESLPEYMIPAHFMTLPALPVNTNGKIDRKALPSPQISRRSSEYVAPTTEEEKALTTVWQEVLGVERVGIRDDFFESGGNSMAAIKLTLAVKSKFGRTLDFRHLIQFPTIESLLAAFHSNGGAAEVGDENITRFREGSATPLFLTHSLVGNTIHFTAFCRSFNANVPDDLAVYGLELPLKDPSDPALATMEDLARYHVKIMRRVQPRGPYRIAGFSFGGVLAYEIARQLLDENEPIEYLGILDASKPSRDLDWLLNDDSRAQATNILTLFLGYFNPDLTPAEMARYQPQPEQEVGDALQSLQLEGLIPEEFTLERLLEMSAVRHALATIHARYQPQPLSQDIPVHVVTSTEGLTSKGEFLGWEFGSNGFWKSTNIPQSTHLGLTNSPLSDAMAEVVSDAIRSEMNIN